MLTRRHPPLSRTARILEHAIDRTGTALGATLLLMTLTSTPTDLAQWWIG